MIITNKIYALILAAAISISPYGAIAQTAAISPDSMTMSPGGVGNASSISAADRQFFSKAAIGGMTEIEAGKLAVAQGSSDDVKAFGQRMIDDHTKAAEGLKAIAEKKGVVLPDAPDAQHEAMLARLKSKQGKAFDTAFIADMQKGHRDAIAVFTAATRSKDSDVSQFASTTLPTLKDHQKTIPMTTAMQGDTMKMGDDTPSMAH